MLNLVQDLRYALRKLGRTPAFTIVAVVTLAVAVGATTAIFSVVNSVLLEPLPFAAPDRLVFIASTGPTGAVLPASPQDLSDYRDQSDVFTSVAAMDPGESVTLTSATGPAVRLSEARVGATFFSILGVRPQMGRFFAPGEDTKSAAKVVVLSDRGWRKYFGGDPRIIGRTVTLDKADYRVVGIAGPSTTLPHDPDVWLPAVWHEWEIGDAARGYHSIQGVARLRDGATVAGARRELTAVAGRLARDFPNHNAKIGAFVQPLQERLVGDVGHALWAMLGAVGFVLLIACANVANLLLARAAARETELAVRTALGAARRRLVRQLLTESLVLSAGGAVLGAFLATWAVEAVVAFGPADLPRLNEVSIDARVLAITAVVALLTGVVFGVVPALQAARTDVSQVLHGAGRGSSAGGRNATRASLVVVEMSLAMVLLVGAGLLVRSFEKRLHVDPGFNPSHLLVFDVALSGDKYEEDAALNGFADAIQARLAALPGARGVAVAAERPADPDSPFNASAGFTIDGAPKPPPGSEFVAAIAPVSPSYFTTVGMSLLRGRFFMQAEDRVGVPPVVVVNEEFARRFFPNENPVGRSITFGFSHTTTKNPADSVRVRGEIVGIVKTAMQSTLGERPNPVAYVPYATLPLGATFLVRTKGDPVAVEGQIRRQVHDVDPTVPVYELGTMDDAMSASVAQPRFYTTLFGTFAAIALFLATLGIYGVISYAVSQRTREFGIRIALGATAPDVARLVVARGVMLAVGGVGIGLLAALVVTRSIQALLFGVDPLDAPTFAVVALVLGATGVLASWLPARHASRVDPVVAMRAE